AAAGPGSFFRKPTSVINASKDSNGAASLASADISEAGREDYRAQAGRQRFERLKTAAVQVAALSLITACVSLSRSAIGPLQESHRIALQLTDNQIAILQGPALSFPLVAFAIPLGLLADRMSRAKLIAILAACNIVGNLLTVLAGSF